MRKDEKLNIAVVGLGHVGLSLALTFAKKYTVTGYDSNIGRIKQLHEGVDYKGGTTVKQFEDANIEFTSDPTSLQKAGFIIIAVASILDMTDQPNLSFLVEACNVVGKHMKKGAVIVFETTVYPGATEEKCIPMLEEFSGLESGVEFFVGYSPVRFNPGETKLTYTKIKKVVAGQNDAVLDYVADIYSNVIDAGVYKAKSIRIAEAAKVIENVQQDVNIALINEFSIIFNHLGIDTGDVLETVRTKKNFQNTDFNITGGTEFGKYSHFLSYKARTIGYEPKVIVTSRKVNNGMSKYIARTVAKRLIQLNMPAQEIKITVLGITHKEDARDLRNARIIDVIEELNDYGFKIQIADCCADAQDAEQKFGLLLTAEHELKTSSAIILAIPHTEYKEAGWTLIQSLLNLTGGIVFDFKRILDPQGKPENIELWRL